MCCLLNTTKKTVLPINDIKKIKHPLIKAVLQSRVKATRKAPSQRVPTTQPAHLRQYKEIRTEKLREAQQPNTIL